MSEKMYQANANNSEQAGTDEDVVDADYEVIDEDEE